jgi:hypothetical protein
MDDNQLCHIYLKWAFKEVAQWMEKFKETGFKLFPIVFSKVPYRGIA